MSDHRDLRQLVRDSAAESLPGDYVDLTGRRLGIAAVGSALLYFVYLVLHLTVWAAKAHWVGMFSCITALVVSIGVAVYVLKGSRPAARLTSLAVGYEIFLASVLALMESWSVNYETSTVQVPWGAVVITLFPFLIPASTRVVLAASLAAAATTPLAMALVCGLGFRPWPQPSVALSFVLPPLLCALLAWAPTSALHRLGKAVQQARRLGSYELTERLGQGGMGEVWRANHRLLARPAAVKLIKPEMLGAQSARSRAALIQRFEKEAQATASLQSTHSVELYDFGVSSEGVLFYVMELLYGVDLQALVERFGPLPAERVIYLLLQACDSLEDAHCRGLIHRDIKPANLFVARKGPTCDFLKVLDFGLVKRWHAQGELDGSDSLVSLANAQSLQTGLGQIVGTPTFLAPEVALGELNVDGRADLYALGCVAYFLLTGVVVFEETSAVSMAVAHVTKEPVPPSKRVSWPIDAELEQIVMSCLHKDRERRPSSATELCDRLSAIALREPWSRERAAQWWHEHLPASVGGSAALFPATPSTLRAAP